MHPLQIQSQSSAQIDWNKVGKAFKRGLTWLLRLFGVKSINKVVIARTLLVVSLLALFY